MELHLLEKDFEQNRISEYKHVCHAKNICPMLDR
jgi:hypothetical protein